MNRRGFLKAVGASAVAWKAFKRITDRLTNTDPLLSFRGSGKHLWADEHADEYVHRLRAGWE